MHYAIQHLNWKPSEWLRLSDEEKAFMVASMMIKAENQKKVEKEIQK